MVFRPLLDVFGGALSVSEQYEVGLFDLECDLKGFLRSPSHAVFGVVEADCFSENAIIRVSDIRTTSRRIFPKPSTIIDMPRPCGHDADKDNSIIKKVTRASDHRSIHAQTIITLVFQEHTAT